MGYPPVSNETWTALFELGLELNGKAEMYSESLESTTWWLEDAYESAEKALRPKCDSCGKRSEGPCCVEVTLVGEWDLL